MRRALALSCSDRRRASRRLVRRSPPQAGESGFTLLELTIAMVCMVLVAGGIALSISTCLNVWNRATETAELNQEARAVLELISRDLRNLYLGLDRRAGYLIAEKAVQAGGGSSVDTLELASQGQAVERFTLLPDEVRGDWQDTARPPLTDYVSVRYQWLPGTSDRAAGLYRVVGVTPLAPEDETAEAAVSLGEEQPEQEVGVVACELVSSSVQGLRFQYYDGTEEEWVDSWDTRGDTPHPLLAVRVEVTLKDARGQDHVFETTVPIASYG